MDIHGKHVHVVVDALQERGRNYCGNELNDGMVKNKKLPTNIVTPNAFKEKEHDRPISLADIVKEVDEAR